MVNYWNEKIIFEIEWVFRLRKRLIMSFSGKFIIFESIEILQSRKYMSTLPNAFKKTSECGKVE